MLILSTHCKLKSLDFEQAYVNVLNNILEQCTVPLLLNSIVNPPPSLMFWDLLLKNVVEVNCSQCEC